MGPLLRVIEEHEIEDYKVEAPTLEQVFLNVVANAKAIEDAAEKTTMLEGLGSSGRDVSFVRAQEAAPAPLHLSSSTTSNFWREMAAIYLKRWMIIRRSYIPVLAVFFIPIAVAVATRGLIGGYKMDDCVRSANQRRSLNNENQGIDIQGFPRSEDLNMYLNQYKSNRVLLAPTQSWGPKQIGAVQEVIGDYAYVANKIYSPDLADFKTQVEENFQTIPLALYYDTEGKQDILGVNMQLPIQYAAMPLNFMNQVRINASGSDLKIQPLVGTMIGSQNTPPGLGWAIIFVFFFGFAMAVAAAFPALYPTWVLIPLYLFFAMLMKRSFERVRKVRALHYSNGVRPAPLWLGHLLYEGTFLVISGIICALIIATNNPSAWYQPLYLILIFALYAIASTLLSFVVSLFAKSALAAFPAMAGLNSLMHTIFMVIYLVLFTVGSAEELSGSLDHVFYALGCVFPIANLDRAVFVSLNLFSISCNPATAATRGNSGFRHTPIAFDLYGGPAVFLAVQSILYFLLLVWWELGRPLPIPRRRAKAGVVSLDPYSPLPTAALVVSSLSKRFGSSKTQAVSDLSFHVSANETFCLLGPNGAGKTTTLSMVLGEMHPDSGDILVAGKSVVRGHHRRSTKLSVCPQFDATDNLTVTQTLRFYARVKGVSHPKRNVDTLINAVGLERFVDTKADALSGGNRRKLSLAIALLGNPSVILLDEPSSGMDASAKRSMWATLKAVSPGRAVVLTTHSMEESTALASRVGILGGGRMRESGTVRELTERLGRWHHVQIVCDSAPHTKPAEIVELGEWVAAEFGVAAEEGGLGQMRFRVKASAWSVGEVFRRLEGREGVKYAVQETGLEDVFLAVGRRMEEEKEKEKVWEEEDM